jgi:hypothetical protein
MARYPAFVPYPQLLHALDDGRVSCTSKPYWPPFSDRTVKSYRNDPTISPFSLMSVTAVPLVPGVPCPSG